VDYLNLANSPAIFFACLIPVGIIVFQAVKLIAMSYKQGLSIGMKREDLNKCIRTAASISILPALSLVTLMIALAPSIGVFFSWLRLSNIGAGAYETLAAGIAASAAGVELSSLGNATNLMTVYITMNLGMIVGTIVVLVSLKSYDKTLRKQRKSNPFLLVATSAMFLGILARLTMPYVLNGRWLAPFRMENQRMILPFFAVITGALVMAICQLASKKAKIFQDFSLTFSIIGGIVVCIVASVLLPR
jgi:hypothetical protein